MSDNELYRQISDQLYINGFCLIDQWQNVILNNEGIEIKAQAIMNNKGFIHLRKMNKIKNAIKLQMFHFGKNKVLIYDGFEYIFKGSGIYNEIEEEQQ